MKTLTIKEQEETHGGASFAYRVGQITRLILDSSDGMITDVESMIVLNDWLNS